MVEINALAPTRPRRTHALSPRRHQHLAQTTKTHQKLPVMHAYAHNKTQGQSAGRGRPPHATHISLTRHAGSDAMTTCFPWCETLKFQFRSRGDTEPSSTALLTPPKNGLFCSCFIFRFVSCPVSCRNFHVSSDGKEGGGRTRQPSGRGAHERQRGRGAGSTATKKKTT